MRRQSIRAFTLVELLIVMVLLGILATVVFKNYIPVRDVAQRKVVGQQATAIQNSCNTLVAAAPTLAGFVAQFQMSADGTYLAPKNPADLVAQINALHNTDTDQISVNNGIIATQAMTNFRTSIEFRWPVPYTRNPILVVVHWPADS